jgi:hypothetical protein
MSVNDHIEDYLYEYLKMDNPQYAVMLTGGWGCGKTFFIDTYLNEKSPPKNGYIKVSLYGLSHINQINDEFYTQLHPRLSSKGMKLAAKVGKGLLKTSLKIDIDGDGKDDGSASLQIPNINLPDFLTNLGEKLLVFDDLERCNIPTSQVLGYINTFVEQDHHKVIIVANEIEISKHDKDKYTQIKEKLIGQTLELQSSLDDALDTFLKNIEPGRVQSFYQKNTETIKSLYHQSGAQNLRILQQLLWTFERFSKCLTNEQWGKTDAILELMKLIFAVGFLMKSNTKHHLKLTSSEPFIYKTSEPHYRNEQPRDDEIDELWALIDPSFAMLEDNHKKLLPKIREIENNFEETTFSSEILPETILKELFLKGIVDNDKIQSHLKANRLFFEEQASAEWQILWHHFSYSHNEVVDALSKTENKLSEYSYTQLGEILHVVGLRIEFADNGLINKTKEEVLSEAKAYIDTLYEKRMFNNDEIESITNRHSDFFAFNSSHGLGFRGLEAEEFKTLKKYLHEKVNDYEKVCFEDQALKLMKISNTNFQEFYEALCLTNDTHNRFYRKPILAHIPPKMFTEHIMNSEPSQQRSFFHLLKDRYSNNTLSYDLEDEVDWLKDVSEEFEIAINSSLKFDKYRLGSMKKASIDKILEPFIE